MKKHLLYMAAGLILVSTACQNSDKKNTQAEDTATEIVADPVATEKSDTVAVDTVGYTTTATGLKYKAVKKGNGVKPSATDEVTVHYTGKLLDGTTFDSSVERGEPATFPLDRVIKGWTEGLQLMGEGSKYQFIIPSELAYGEQGAGDNIGPGATLYFEVELIKVNK